ncbi:MAG: AAA family ATPase [Desulfococcaceae bacterium]
MRVTRLRLKNWLNFRDVEIPLADRCYLIGPNACGKSNFLEAFRFLRDIAKPAGGGLQKAVTDRGGIRKLRCLQARKDAEIRVETWISDSETEWAYFLGFKSEGRGAQRLWITDETVRRNGEILLRRPDKDDRDDPVRLTQTFLEQINANVDFRSLAEFFSDTTYLHLVPQLLTFGDQMAVRRMEDDPFGQGFLERLAKTQKKTRDSRLKRIQNALTAAVPQFDALRFTIDAAGHPHLEARYAHWRPNAGWQTEEQFSYGTLRLIGLLWSLMEGDGLLLLEEPELSLNDGVVEHIPLMIDRVLRESRRRRQVLVSTHSEALLRNPLDGRGILLLEPGRDGTRIRLPDEAEAAMLQQDFSPAEIFLPKTRPEKLLDWEASA